MSLRSTWMAARPLVAYGGGALRKGGVAVPPTSTFARLVVGRHFSSTTATTKENKTTDDEATTATMSSHQETLSDTSYHNDDPRFVNSKPTLSYAKSLPLGYSAMRHEQILQLSAEGKPQARREALIRNIMAIDEVEYDEAVQTFETKVKPANRQGMLIAALPHHIGLFTAVTGGFVSIPLVFYLPMVQEFNRLYVTADIPPPEDLETWLEVGSWSWAWNEPVLGHISFFLLAMQFARSQMQNLGIQPYTKFMKDRRAKRLCQSFPQYDSHVLADYSKSDEYYK